MRLVWEYPLWCPNYWEESVKIHKKLEYWTQGETLEPKLLPTYAQQEIYHDRKHGTWFLVLVSKLSRLMSSIKNQIQYNLIELHKVEEEYIIQTWELLSISGEKMNVPGWYFGVRATSSYYKKADVLSLNSSWKYYSTTPSDSSTYTGPSLFVFLQTSGIFTKLRYDNPGNKHHVTCNICLTVHHWQK